MSSPLLGRYRLAAGAVFVLASMTVMFELPAGYFIEATFVSTTCMALVSIWMGGYRRLFSPSVKSVFLGLASAGVLYLTFLGGGLAIALFHPLGLSANSENAIYSLIASTSNPGYLQVTVLLFDAVGYESFFRGVLQRQAQSSLGIASPFVAAAADAAIHILTLNPLWVVTTFIADAAWGITYFYAKDITSSMTSHFVWDILIFVLLPIR